MYVWAEREREADGGSYGDENAGIKNMAVCLVWGLLTAAMALLV